MKPGEDERRGPSRKLLVLPVWAVAIVWSVYLVSDDLNGDGGIFTVIVQTMGSLGILYTLFLVTKPQKRGGLELRAVSRRDVVSEGGGEQDQSGVPYDAFACGINRFEHNAESAAVKAS